MANRYMANWRIWQTDFGELAYSELENAETTSYRMELFSLGIVLLQITSSLHDNFRLSGDKWSRDFGSDSHLQRKIPVF